jgi:hypothetical protein
MAAFSKKPVTIQEVRRLLTLTFAIALLTLTGCGTTPPETDAFVTSPNVSAMAPLVNGGLRYGNRLTGNIYEVDKDGHGSQTPIATVNVSTANGNGLVGLAVDSNNGTFAAWTNAVGALTVGQVAPGPTRVIWSGPILSAPNSGGQLTFSPDGRLLVALADNAAKIYNSSGDVNTTTPSSAHANDGELLTLDPSGDASQLPNAISTGWVNPIAAYSGDNVLWVADNKAPAAGTLAQGGDNGPTGAVTNLAPADQPVGIAPYDTNEELALCFGGNHELKRFLLNDGTEALPDHVLAHDCAYGVVELHDGRLAYATVNGIRTTVL